MSVEDGKLTYLETEAEVIDTALAAIRYVFEGKAEDAISDLRGLCVYGVVGALREHDSDFHGPQAVLDVEQKEHLEEVETEVDKAVEKGMQFYPFGHDEDRYAIDYDIETADKDTRQRALIGGIGNSIRATSGKTRASHKRNIRRGVIADATATKPPKSPVVIKKMDEK